MSGRTRTVFLGTGEFAVPVVAALSDDQDVNLVAVVSGPERVGSRNKPAPAPVVAWAAERGLRQLRPARLRAPETVDEIRALDPELLVLADYGQIVPGTLLDVPRHGALNLHPSLLPRHRGAIPIPAAILAGDRETGVTLMRMDEGLDTGSIIAQRRVPLSGSETSPMLEGELARVAADLLIEALGGWLSGDINAAPQPTLGATVTHPLRRADGRIDPSLSAAELERRIRAFQPWPGSFLELGADRLVVWRAHVVGDVPDVDVGSVWRTEDGGLGLRTRDAGLILDEVQPAGGRRMSSAELVRGRPTIVGSKVAPSAEADS